MSKLRKHIEGQPPKKLAALVSNLDETVKALPEQEQRSYEEAEKSVVDARRKAEAHEGLLQLN